MTGRSRSATTTAASGVVSATASGRTSRRPAKTPASSRSQSNGQVVSSPKMKTFLEAKKRDADHVLVGPIERMLLEQGDEGSEPRRADVLHVSELAKSSFCPRAAFLRITGALQHEDSAKMRLQAIFEEGHDVHAKWQRWIRRLGRLYGRWLCVVCESSWMGTSPEQCVTCDAPGWKLLYREVPVDCAETHFIVGHGDGQLDDKDGPWVEIKTIGIGTVRMEAPALLSKYSHKGVHLDDIDRLLEWVTGQYREEFLSDGKIAAEIDDIPSQLLSRWVDFDALWKNIRRPFPSHLRQGHCYAGLMGVDEVVFVYEYKPNQAHKQFVIEASPEIYEPMLETALDVKWAVEHDRPPKCPHVGCKECGESEQGSRGRSATSTAGRSSQSRERGKQGTRDEDVRPDVGSHRGDDPREGRGREDSAGVRATPRRRITRTARRPDSAGRQPVDGTVQPVHGLGRLLRDAPRAG